MKLFHSASSPFVRKVLVVAHEVGLADRIALQPAAAHPIDRSAAIRAENPLGQVPTLVTDDGLALYDSRVICEYLDALGGGSLFGRGPGQGQGQGQGQVHGKGKGRWRILAWAAMGDGLMGAALLARYEAAVRPASLRWDDWTEGQMSKVEDVLDALERIAPELDPGADIATITFGCALAYLDFRFPERAWRRDRPAAAAWYEGFGPGPRCGRPSRRADPRTGVDGYRPDRPKIRSAMAGKLSAPRPATTTRRRNSPRR